MFKAKIQYLLTITVLCLIIFSGCPKIDDTNPGGMAPTATPVPGQTPTPAPVPTQAPTLAPTLAPTSAPTSAPTLVPQIPAIDLGTAANFAVLAGSTITNTGNTVISGNLGLSPGSALVGFPPGTHSGVAQLANATAATAKTDLTAAYTDAAARTGVVTIPTELGGTTLVPGVYASAAGTFGITGTLVLNAQGNANAVWIFKAASTLITASASNVSLINGAQALNVFWQVGSSATLGTNSSFKGNILAQASITATTGVAVEGRLLAQTAAVTMDTNTIVVYTSPTPTATPSPSPTPTPSPTPSPSPSPSPVPQLAVNLGSAANFAILAGSTITNTGNTVVTGNIGLSPGNSLVGFPPGTYSGGVFLANPTAATAKVDLTAAYTDAANRTGALTVGTELGGTILTAGAYNSAAGTFGITGTLTLDGQGNPGAVFIFQAASTLITASGSNVVLINGAQAQNIFWQVGSSATLGTGSTFRGNIMALASITVTTSTAIYGRALAQTGAVTMDTNTIQ